MTARACAHRGDSGVLRENTLPAVRSALAKGAAVVETAARTRTPHAPAVTRSSASPRVNSGGR